MRTIQQEFPHCISKACKVLATSRSNISYQSIKDDTALIGRLNDFSKEHPREGFWKAYYRLRNAGTIVNHKRLHRVYKNLGLPMRRKIKKRLPERVKEPLEVPPYFNHTWSIDFMSDATTSGLKFRSFNVMDDYNREALHIELDYSLKSSRVIYVLNHLIKRFTKPKKIRMDNGPEFIAILAKEWSEANEICFQYIQPGKPMQNGYIERFNRTYREQVLDAYMIYNLEEVREITEKFMKDYNNYRPHDSLGGLSPIMYKNKNEMNHSHLLHFA